MVKREIVKTTEFLKKLLKDRNIKVHKIVVFGSYAKGKQTEESDIDIIVISENFEGKDIFERVELVQGIHRKLVEKTMVPFDMMYYSPSEWEQGNSLIINAAKEEGEVVF